MAVDLGWRAAKVGSQRRPSVVTMVRIIRAVGDASCQEGSEVRCGWLGAEVRG